MSTLESASCPHVQDRVLQEANILNIERLVKKSLKVFQLLMLLQSNVPYLPLHGSTLDLLGKWTTPLLEYSVTAFSVILQDVVTLSYYNTIQLMSLL